jgi:hypothetical protein
MYARTYRSIIFLGSLMIILACTAGPRTPTGAQVNVPFEQVIIDSNGPDGPWLKTIGDIDGDGRTDLIVGGVGSGGLVWYENPTWTKHSISTASGFSTDAEVADVDGDGDNDILYLTTGEIGWLENPSWAVHSIESRVLHDLEISDFDGDGDIDIVARNQGEFGGQGNELHFYRQNSPESWTHRAVAIPNGEGLKVADIDMDGDEDVVVNGSWFENTNDILGGPWPEHVFTTSWTHPNTFIGVGDINGDGRPDIALAPAELQGQYYRISWFEAPADPTQNDWAEHIVDNNVEAVHHFIGVADMNNDGHMDLAAAEMHQGANPDEIKVYINDDGNGQSWTKEVFATTGSHSMRILDVDNDGDMDLFGANHAGQQVELYVNLTCDSTLDSWERHVIDPTRPWTAIFIDSADIDGDGLKDIVTGGWWYQNPGSPSGTWTRHAIGSPLNNMAALYDFDQDGKVDILGTRGQGAASDPRFVWARNLGGGSFTIIENVPDGEGDFLQGVDVARLLAGEGITVGLSWHAANMGIQTLSVPVDPVNTTWTWSRISVVSQDEALTMGDIDRDDDLDMLLGTIWLENMGSAWEQHLLHDTNGAPYGESDPDRNRLADINGDGRLDAIVGYEAISVLGKLAWYEQGPSATSIWTEHIIAEVVGPMSLDVVDMDGDGDLDVIVGEHNLSDPNSAELSIFENVDGGGSIWAKHIVYTGDEHHDGALVVDIDGDGDLDIISIGWGHDDVLLYENKSGSCIPTDLPPIMYMSLVLLGG